MRKSLIMLFLAFLFSVFAGMFAGTAVAQIPTSGNVYFGYSYLNTDASGIDRTSTNGWEASAEGRVLPFIGIVADFSAEYGSENFPAACPENLPPCIPFAGSVNIAEYNYLFGPRFSFPVGKFRPFGEVLFGAGHINANNAGSDTSFATAIGGGIDYRLLRFVAWRVQGDYVQTRFFSTTQNNVRISTGIVLRF
jgi:hypothetical protein